MVRLGIERLCAEQADEIAGERIGLVTNPSGVDRDCRSTINLLTEHPAVTVERLFGPEHGIRGSAAAAEAVRDTVDERTGLPVTSLYGERRRPPAETLTDLDALVYDVQDVGARYYTVVYTLAYALEAAAERDIRFVVLDRPNPVAPLGVTGNRVSDEHASFVGDYGLPVTHGLTPGELAGYVAGEFDVDVELTVVELADWSRDTWFDDTDLPWVPPSPNVPTPETATLYPGTCLVEAVTFSEGRGTALPFQLVGAPWVSSDRWAERLNGFGFDGVRFRPTYFTPRYDRYENEEIEGVHIHLRDCDDVRPFAIGLAMLVSAMADFPETEWVTVDDDYFVDRLIGSSTVRERIETGDFKDPRTLAEEQLDGWAAERTDFERLRVQYERY